MNNCFSMKILAKAGNEAFARSAVAAFAASLNPDVDQINDIKTAVSEAVTNCIVHAYGGDSENYITVDAEIDDSTVFITVADSGVGIDDIELAMQPFYTTATTAERTGMGFTVMESFMDTLEVLPNSPSGLVVKMSKTVR